MRSRPLIDRAMCNPAGAAAKFLPPWFSLAPKVRQCVLSPIIMVTSSFMIFMVLVIMEEHTTIMKNSKQNYIPS
jgi:hypothetical protein